MKIENRHTEIPKITRSAKFSAITAAIVFAAVFSGCTDISHRTIATDPIESGITSEITAATNGEVPSEIIEAAKTDDGSYIDSSDSRWETDEETPAETQATEVIDGEIYTNYVFSEENQSFLNHIVFVGDSICMGLSSYGVLETSQVLAHGSVGARNIDTFSFSFGDGESDYLTSLVNISPDIIVLSMGMNDVNVTTTEDFCANYTAIIKKIRAYLPHAKLIALSITPVAADSDFTENANINTYNAALKKAIEDYDDRQVCWLDVTGELKNSAGALKTRYSSGDGVHLTDTAYYAILWQICNNAEW